MTEIPESVMEEARNIVRQWQTRAIPNQDEVAFIAASLLAAEKRGEARERERCAKIAETFALVAHPDTTNRLYQSVEFRPPSGPRIAAAIRKETD